MHPYKMHLVQEPTGILEIVYVKSKWAIYLNFLHDLIPAYPQITRSKICKTVGYGYNRPVSLC